MAEGQFGKMIRASKLLREASELLESEANTSRHPDERTFANPVAGPSSSRPSAAERPERSTGNATLATSVNRARQMLNASSRSGLFNRLNQQERLRASVNHPRRPLSQGQQGRKRKAAERAIDFALLKCSEVCGDTLKWDSVLTEGIIMVSEDDTEKEIRLKVRDSLRGKYELIGQDDFEFVKVRQKRISVPQLQPGTGFNYQVVKKMTGQGLLYVQMKPGSEYVTDDDDHDDSIKDITDEVLLQPCDIEKDLYEERKNVREEEKKNEVLSFSEAPFNVKKLIAEISEASIIDPVELLRCLQKKMHKGRDLQISDVTLEPEGETNYISVDRQKILDTTFSELQYIKDYRVTFEVDFMGEMARDLGGPRLEWIELVNREMKRKYFDHGLREHLAEDYFYVGAMCGIAMLQNGQVPRIYPDDVLEKMFNPSQEMPSCQKNIQKGLQVFGMQEIFLAFPILRHLFQSNSSLSANRLIQIMKPIFSQEGASALQREKEIYGVFIKYIREVASGRRVITLGDILSFVTGSSEEPVLGFAIKPTLCFTASEEYFVEVVSFAFFINFFSFQKEKFQHNLKHVNP